MSLIRRSTTDRRGYHPRVKWLRALLYVAVMPDGQRKFVNSRGLPIFRRKHEDAAIKTYQVDGVTWRDIRAGIGNYRGYRLIGTQNITPISAKSWEASWDREAYQGVKVTLVDTIEALKDVRPIRQRVEAARYFLSAMLDGGSNDRGAAILIHDLKAYIEANGKET